MIPADVVFTSAVGLILVTVSIGGAVLLIARARWVDAERRFAEVEYRRLEASLTHSRGEAEGFKVQVETLEAENRRRAERCAQLDTVVRLLREEVEDREKLLKEVREAVLQRTVEAEAADEECCRLRQELSRLRTEGRNANEIFQRRCVEMRDQWKAEGEMIAKGLKERVAALESALKNSDRAWKAEEKRANRAENEVGRIKNESSRLTYEAGELHRKRLASIASDVTKIGDLCRVVQSEIHEAIHDEESSFEDSKAAEGVYANGRHEEG